MDLWGWTRGDPSAIVAAQRMLGVGVLTALVAAPFGWHDWRTLPEGSRCCSRRHRMAWWSNACSNATLSIEGTGYPPYEQC